MVEVGRKSISHGDICKKVANLLDLKICKTSLLKEIKADCVAEDSNGLVLLEGEALSEDAAISNLHIEGHLSRILGVIASGKTISRIYFIVGERRKMNRIQSIYTDWRNYMINVVKDTNILKLPLMFIELSYDQVSCSRDITKEDVKKAMYTPK